MASNALSKFYTKSYIHGYIAVETGALLTFLTTKSAVWDWKSFLISAVAGLAAPLTRWGYAFYGKMAAKYPVLRLFIKKYVKLKLTPAEAEIAKAALNAASKPAV